VAFYAIGTDPFEPLDELVQYKEAQGYIWPVSMAPAGMLPDYSILVQSTKVAIDGEGIITFREGYGRKSSDIWRQLFQRLSKS
jgi:hypothetical protein